MSNVESTDPRRRPNPNDSRKRQTSHSPDPDRPDKQARSSWPNGPASPKNASSSRQSSISNGPNGTGPIPAAQLNADSRKAAEGGMRYPSGQLNGTSGGGRSTPQHAGATAQNRDIATPNPILAALQEFGSQVAAQASLQLQHDHANQTYTRLCAEFKKQERHLDRFPALIERKKDVRGKALKAVQDAKSLLDQHAAGQSKVIENLAVIINAASRDSTTQENIVAQHNSLSSAINAFQQQISKLEQDVKDARETAQGATTQASNSMKEVKEACIVADQAKCESSKATDVANKTKAQLTDASSKTDDAKKAADEAMCVAQDAKEKAGEVVKTALKSNQDATEALRLATEAGKVASQASRSQAQIDNVINDVEQLKHETRAQKSSNRSPSRLDENNQLQQVRQELATIKTESNRYAGKSDVAELEEKYERLAQDVAGARKTSSALSKNIDQMKSVKPSSAPDLQQKVNEVDQKLATILQLVNTDDERQKHNIRDQGGLLSFTSHLEKELQKMNDDLASLTNDVNEPGKGTARKRFKKLDHAVNNLYTQVGEGKLTISQRIAAAEKRIETLQQSVESGDSNANVLASQASLEEGEIRSQKTETRRLGSGDLITHVEDLESKYTVLRAELDDFKKSVGDDSPTGHVTQDDPDVATGKLADMEDKLNNLIEQQDGRDAIMMEEINGMGTSLREEISRATTQNKEALMTMTRDIEELKTKVGRLEESLQDKVGQEAYNHDLAATLQPVRDTLHRLQTQVAQLQNQRQASMSTPQSPAAFGQPPQVPNGLGSPQLNGGPHRGPTPKQRAPTPQGQAVHPPQEHLTRLQAQFDALVLAQQHLKQRYDNLTTDDLFRAMADQMSTMYPEARNFSSTHKALAKQTGRLEDEIKALKQGNAGYPAEVHSLRLRVDALEQGVRNVDETTKRLEQDVAGMKNSANPPALSKAPESNVIAEDVRAMKDKLDEVDRLSKGHSTCLSSLNLTPQRMDELKVMEDVVKQHGERIEGVEKRMKQVEVDQNGLTEEIGQTNGWIKGLEALQKAQAKD